MQRPPGRGGRHRRSPDKDERRKVIVSSMLILAGLIGFSVVLSLWLTTPSTNQGQPLSYFSAMAGCLLAVVGGTALRRTKR